MEIEAFCAKPSLTNLTKSKKFRKLQDICHLEFGGYWNLGSSREGLQIGEGHQHRYQAVSHL